MTADPFKPALPQRLKRLERIFARSPIYFITACAAERRNIFANDVVHDSFVRFGIHGPKHGAWIGKYVLMPDHFHAFVALDDEGLSLSDWMKSLKNALSKTLRSQNISVPHFQKDFFDHVMRSEESYAQKWEYVRQNPVRAGLVAQPEDWPYQGEIFCLEYNRE